MNTVSLEAQSEIAWKGQRPSAEMAVYTCCDRNWIPPAAFLACQIAALEPIHQLDVVIVVTEPFCVPDSLRDAPIHWAELRLNARSIPLPTSRRIPLSAYARFFVPGHLRGTQSRLLYLDPDLFMRCAGIVDHLLRREMRDPVAASADILALINDPFLNALGIFEYWDDIGMRAGDLYRNSGVLLFDVEQYLDGRYLEQMMEYSSRRPETLRFHDQSLLNAVMSKKMGPLSFRWNFPYFDITEHEVAAVSPVLLHHASRPKPWEAQKGQFRADFRAAYATFFDRHFPDFAESRGKAATSHAEDGQKEGDGSAIQPESQLRLRRFVRRPVSKVRFKLEELLFGPAKIRIDPAKWQRAMDILGPC